MPIVTEDAPDGLLDLVEAGLASLPPAPDGAEGAEVTQMYHPLPVFSATLQALARQDGDGGLPLERVSWRVLVDELPTLSLAEVGAIDGEPGMTALWRGAVAEVLANASAVAEDIPDDGRLYRARIIALPEIGLEALWLHADHENDMVVRLVEAAVIEPIAAFAAEARRRAGGQQREREVRDG